ncbi:hypothetical protein [Jejuia pallidilutea]|uniref:Uncharacterized protein n=1 Tax=Jejuia pallidilutea TaxID=504487 RepID=A0A090W6Q9_9FLAO|nr:hypothetical protein JCM19302_2365 [Jejuia pallidilutea]
MASKENIPSILVEQGVISLKDIFVDGTKIEGTINQINEALKAKRIDRKVKQKLNYAKKNWPATWQSTKGKKHLKRSQQLQ